MANSQDNIFKLRFFNDDESITPESFSLREIGELFVHIDEAIKSIIDNDFPDINIDDIQLSPVGIENKSESLLISTNNSPVQTIDALYFFGSKVDNNTYINLPEKAYKGFRYIYSLAEKKQCKAEAVHKEKRVFSINLSNPLIKPEAVIVPLESILYGEIIKLGGDKDRVWVELTNGNRLSFNITRDQVIELGHRMHETVAFKGKAKWNPQSNFITSFTLFEILSYKPGNVSRAFAELRKISNGSWDDLKTNEDISKFLGRGTHE